MKATLRSEGATLHKVYINHNRSSIAMRIERRGELVHLGPSVNIVATLVEVCNVWSQLRQNDSVDVAWIAKPHLP